MTNNWERRPRSERPKESAEPQGRSPRQAVTEPCPAWRCPGLWAEAAEDGGCPGAGAGAAMAPGAWAEEAEAAVDGAAEGKDLEQGRSLGPSTEGPDVHGEGGENPVCDRSACVCDEGWTGPECEAQLGGCVSAPCAHGGTCHPQPSGYNCTCPAGYTGEAPEPHTRCREGGPGGACDRPRALPPPGPACTEEVSACHSGPCLNGGSCSARPGGHLCTCPPGHTGPRCESRDLCAAGECLCQSRRLGLSGRSTGGAAAVVTDRQEASPRLTPPLPSPVPPRGHLRGQARHPLLPLRPRLPGPAL